jgi:predicted phage baseplate assembly protein
VATRAAEISPPGEAPWVRIADDPPANSRYDNLRLSGNVVLAGHGESKPIKVLGSGNGALNHQRFLLEVNDVSFVPDPAMPSGVRADLVVSVAGEVWAQVANLRDSGPAQAHYQVRQSEDGTLWIEFGDGRNGRRLPTGGNNVVAKYRQGVGAGGILEAGSLVKPVHPHPLVAAVRQAMDASGGGERESAASLRENAASALLALERAVSLGDYAALARGNAGVAQASAFRLATGRGQREKVEVVVVPAAGGSFTPALKASLEAFLLGHSLPGVQVIVSGYQSLPVRLKATVRVRPEAFEPEVVEAAVAAALAGTFALERRRLGQALYRSEVYAVVDAVDGVENSDVEILIGAQESAAAKRVVKDASGRVLAVHAQPRQCVHLADAAGVEVQAEDFSL